jgi:hypothetical protein
MKKIVLLHLLVLLSHAEALGSTARAADSAQPQQGDTYALIVNGISKDRQDSVAKAAIVADLRKYMQEKAGANQQRLTVLSADTSGPQNWDGTSTTENIKTTVDALVSIIKPADRLIFYYIGQANAVDSSRRSEPEPGGKLRFNLLGPDVTHEELAHWLAGVKANTQLVVLDCPCAALAAKAIAGRGRFIVCAAEATQVYGTTFSSHFVPALAQSESDVNGDGRVSLLEAFAAAAKQIDQWYRQRQLLPTETPSLEDDGDGIPSKRPWRYKLDARDGRNAAQFFVAAGR